MNRVPLCLVNEAVAKARLKKKTEQTFEGEGLTPEKEPDNIYDISTLPNMILMPGMSSPDTIEKIKELAIKKRGYSASSTKKYQYDSESLINNTNVTHKDISPGSENNIEHNQVSNDDNITNQSEHLEINETETQSEVPNICEDKNTFETDFDRISSEGSIADEGFIANNNITR
ncbi:uncharacterized protein CMU_042620 [Cryptosporidium muris RN66]|uniref:Uncharacterized protein n=1 Tax=Cryptosporidium muris (strain RN66) TaxID=441375 RepID=B6AAE7_CRYMR|nr:uncharacterized protein CMU_042620 [Cryptosporidium muris RN66]EEA05188.1 hypothetical protein CMU_042620 [Cryptosporidium muris RN66]|eukprot:XP_002139537.1 hypothetical protein [Cryptosporidium muris RN66]